MKQEPLVSMITVYFNRAEYIDKSIESMLSQTYRNLEVIVIDDGSTDDTMNVLSKFKNPRLRVYTHKNIGFTESIVKAINNYARGELIAIHGSGDISYPDRIQKQADIFQRYKTVQLCGTASENRSIESDSLIDKQTCKKRFLEKKDFLNSPPFTHGTAMFSRKLYHQINGYDLDFKFSQDWDLWLRMLNFGLSDNCYFLSEQLYIRYANSSGISFNSSKAVEQLKYKYFALSLSKFSVDDREKNKQKILKSCFSKNSMFFHKEIRLNLVTRYFKLILMGEEKEAMVLKKIICNDYEGLPFKYKLVEFFLDFLSLLGVKKTTFSNVIRSIFETIR